MAIRVARFVACEQSLHSHCSRERFRRAFSTAPFSTSAARAAVAREAAMPLVARVDRRWA